MNPYPKIQNLYSFDQETKTRTTAFTCAEFGYLSACMWSFTEKIDGTNIRVIYDEDGRCEIRGRTDKAQLHPELMTAIQLMMAPVELTSTTLYGEGYGAGIQTGGCYRADKSFILFDVYDHEHDSFLDQEELTVFAEQYSLPLVPTICVDTLNGAYRRVQAGLRSTFGNFHAEGLVGKPTVPVRGVRGRRLRVKIKHRDYFGKHLTPM